MLAYIFESKIDSAEPLGGRPIQGPGGAVRLVQSQSSPTSFLLPKKTYKIVAFVPTCEAKGGGPGEKRAAADGSRPAARWAEKENSGVVARKHHPALGRSDQGTLG